MSNKYGFLYRLYAWLYFLVRLQLESLENLLTNWGLKNCRKTATQLPTSLTGSYNFTVLITGANSGIGKECAKHFLALGAAKVIIACRDEAKAHTAIEELLKEVGDDKRKNLIFVKLDLSSLESVRGAAAEVCQQVDHLDVLLNNGGVMMCPNGWKSVDGFEYQFATNYLGHFLLTHLLLGKLKAAPKARIVNLTSIALLAGQMDFESNFKHSQKDSFSTYAQSKLANHLFTVALAKRLKRFSSGVSVYSVHPGIIITELQRHLDLVTYLSTSIQRWTAISVQLGAQTSLHCALSQGPEVSSESGYYYE